MLHRRPFLLLAAAALSATRALAHHGWSSFDQSKPIYLAGKVAKVAWRNPHVEAELDVDADLKLPPDLKARLRRRRSTALSCWPLPRCPSARTAAGKSNSRR